VDDFCIAKGCQRLAERDWGITVFLTEVGKAPLCKRHGELLTKHMAVRDAMGTSDDNERE
jgi:hypothetical protein